MEDTSGASDDILQDPRVERAIQEAHFRGLNTGYAEGVREAKSFLSGLSSNRPRDTYEPMPTAPTRRLDTLPQLNARVDRVLNGAGVITIADALDRWETLGDIRGFGYISYLILRNGLRANGHFPPEVPSRIGRPHIG